MFDYYNNMDCTLEDMERKLKIIQGLWDGRVKIINESNCGDIACQIGYYWFYFYYGELELTPENIKYNIDILSLAEMIEEAIVGLEDDDEYNYYCDILEW